MAAFDVLKLFLPAATAFLIGIAITPSLTGYLYSHQMWKKKVRTLTLDGREAKFFSQLHKDKEVGTPRMGGIVIWASVLITTLLFWLLPKIAAGEFADGLNFLSRNQTWLPLFTLITASLVGLIDDYF